jgi:hypothetical protein
MRTYLKIHEREQDLKTAKWAKVVRARYWRVLNADDQTKLAGMLDRWSADEDFGVSHPELLVGDILERARKRTEKELNFVVMRLKMSGYEETSKQVTQRIFRKLEGKDVTPSIDSDLEARFLQVEEAFWSSKEVTEVVREGSHVELNLS